MKIIILFIVAVGFAIGMLISNRQQRGGPKKSKQKTIQEFLNVLDIRDGMIYTKDHYLIGFLQISGRKTDLLSDREKESLNQGMTAELAAIASEWQLLALSQPEDNSALLYQYQEQLVETSDPIRKKLLREAIRYQNELLLSGENMERQFYLKLWEYQKEGVEKELQERLHQYRRCFEDNGYTCDMVSQEEAVLLCNLVHNPAAVLYDPDEIKTDLPGMKAAEN